MTTQGGVAGSVPVNDTKPSRAKSAGLFFLYLIVGSIINGAVRTPSGTSDDAKLASFSEGLGSLIGSFLISYGLIYLVNRYLVKGRRSLVFPFALGLGLLLSLVIGLQKSSFEDRMVALKDNPRLIPVVAKHFERARAVVVGDFPALNAPILSEDLPINPPLDLLQKRRDALRAALTATRDLSSGFHDRLAKALTDDAPTESKELAAIQVDNDLIPRLMMTSDVGILTKSSSKTLPYLQAVGRKYEASLLAMSFMIDTFGQWQQKPDGSYVFATDAQVASFRTLAKAEDEAMQNMQAAEKIAQ